MKKLPTLFVRLIDDHHHKIITKDITPGFEHIVYNENAVGTLKIDGSCCAIIDGEFYRRYDAKFGKTPPEGAIPCCDYDPITLHWPHWIKVDETKPEDKWFIEAYKNVKAENFSDGTYEAIGPHFQNNPYGLGKDMLLRHGMIVLENTPYSFDEIKTYLENHNIEGIVYWKNGCPVCKIKRSDFGIKWPQPNPEAVDIINKIYTMCQENFDQTLVTVYL